MLNTKGLQTVIDATLAEADRLRHPKLLAATRELDVTLEAVAKGQATRKDLVDRVQVVVIQAGLSGATTELDFRDATRAVLAQI